MKDKFIYFVAKCIKSYKGVWEEVDCDGTTRSSMIFNEGENYRVRFISKEAIVYPDNEWDGTYRFEYFKIDEYLEHFELVTIIKEGEELNDSVTRSQLSES